MSTGLLIGLIFWCVMWLAIGLLMKLDTTSGMDTAVVMLLVDVGISAWISQATNEPLAGLGVVTYLAGLIISAIINFIRNECFRNITGLK